MKTPQRLALAATLIALAPTAGAQSLIQQEGLQLDLSLTLDGIYQNRLSGKEREPAGFGHAHHEGHDHGHGHAHGLEEGFNAGHSELAIRARTDLVDGVLTVGFNDKDVEVEEAYLSTRALPAGLRLKAGKFLSDIGYVNSRHSHDWDFIERPLVNQHLFGEHGLQETGVQLSLTPATGNYMNFGLEVLQGNGEGINRQDEGTFHETRSGPRLVTAFAKFGPDLGPSDALQIGVSAGKSRQYSRVDDHGDHKHTLEGDTWFGGVDLMYRHESGKAYGEGNWRIGGEYYYTQRSVNARGWSEARGWRQNPADFTERQDGLYLEAVY